MAPTEASAQLVRQGTTTERYAVTTARWRDRPRTARSMVGGPMGSPGRARRRTRSTVGYGSGSPNGAIPGSPRGAHAPSAYSGTETADRFHQNVATLSQIAIMAIWGPHEVCLSQGREERVRAIARYRPRRACRYRKARPRCHRCVGGRGISAPCQRRTPESIATSDIKNQGEVMPRGQAIEPLHRPALVEVRRGR